MTGRGSRRGWSALGLWLILGGLTLLLTATADISERRSAQRMARESLNADADALAEAAVSPDHDFPLLPPRPSPGAVVGRIVVPSVGVDVLVFEGVDRKTLARGAGHFPGSALPGEPGNASFAAHRDVEFRGLRRIRQGDDVWIETNEATFVYRVSDTRVVAPSEVEVLAPTGRSELTLITCHPFDWVGPAPDRFVVSASLRGRFEPEDEILDGVLGSAGDRS